MKASRIKLAVDAVNGNSCRMTIGLWTAIALAGIAALALLSLTSCDDHLVDDLSWHDWKPGMVYCSNGHVADFDKCTEDGFVPEAVIFYVDIAGEIEGQAYAVGLYETAPESFGRSDTVYAVQGTSADYEKSDGESNTVSMRYGNFPSPIAAALPPKYFIPSVAEYYRLFSARDAVNGTLGLCGGDSLPVSDESCWYWTSTECKGAERDRAWRYSLFSGRFESEDKHTMLPVRPIMMIRLNGKEQ